MSATNSSSAATTGGTDGLHGISATSVVAADLEIDAGTLSVDATNNRIGLGDTAPGTQLQIKSTAPYVTIQNSTSENTDGGCEGKVIFEDHADVSLAQIEGSHSGSSDDTKGQLILSTHTGSALTAGLTIDEAQKSTFAGSVGIGGTASADLSIESSGTADSVIRINHNNAAGDPFVKLTTNAVNWAIGLDNSDSDKFMIASGATPSTNPRLTVDTSGNVGIGITAPTSNLHVGGTTPTVTIGDAGAEDTMLVFDGAAADWRIGIDDGTDVLEIGVGATHGTTTAIGVNASAQTQVLAAFAANVAGTIGTFADGDATPSVATGNLWKHHASAQAITMFDGGIAGQIINVISTAAITYDVTGTNLEGGSVDIVTAAGDVTQWFFDGANWYLTYFMDASADHSVIGAGGGGADANDVDHILHQQVFS